MPNESRQAQQPRPKQGRWFPVLLLPYNDRDPFWDRDAGLFFQGFRANGVDTRFVALGQPRVDPVKGLILAPQSQLEDPAWWKQWDLDGVVLYSWALPKFTGVARAIHDAGIKLVLTLDADGGRSPRGVLLYHLKVKYIYARMARQWFPAAVAVAKTVAGWPNWRYLGVMRHLEYADWIGIQSPLGKQRFGRFVADCGYGHLIDRLTVLHHPVRSEMKYDPAVAKQPLIIAIGGWERLVKGAALLIEVLGLALERHPGYRARVIGGGQGMLHQLASRLPPSVRERIEITGPLSNQVVHRHLQEAQVIVNTSYSESFSIASAEALCCGCSVVGLALLSTFNHFCSEASGTLATARTAGYYCDALGAEIEAWSRGERDPARISAVWTSRLHAERVARAVLDLAREPLPGKATGAPARTAALAH